MNAATILAIIFHQFFDRGAACGSWPRGPPTFIKNWPKKCETQGSDLMENRQRNMDVRSGKYRHQSLSTIQLRGRRVAVIAIQLCFTGETTELFCSW